MKIKTIIYPTLIDHNLLFPKLHKLKFAAYGCGAGKTTALIEEINSSKSDQFFILAFGTNKMQEYVASQINGSLVWVSDKNSQNYCCDILQAVLDYLRAPQVSHKALIISDKIFFKLDPNLLKEFIIYLDDVVTFSSHITLNDATPAAKRLVQDELLKLTPYDMSTSKKAKKGQSSEHYCIGTKRDFSGDITTTVSKTLDIIQDNDQFFMDSSWFYDSSKSQLNITAWRDLQKYIDAGLDMTFIGANFTNSMIYKAHRCLFRQVTLPDIQERPVPLDDRLEIFYFLEHTRASTTWKNDNNECLTKIYDYLSDNLGADYYYTHNNSDDKRKNARGEAYELLGHKISVEARGLNDFRAYETCVWLATLKPSPSEAAHIEHLFGIIYGEFISSREHEAMHQFVLRGCSRDYSSTQIQRVYVLDREQAEALGTNIKHIDLQLPSDNPIKKPVGAPVKQFKLAAAASERCRRKLQKNPTLKEFREWMFKGANASCTDWEREIFMERYEKHQSTAGLRKAA
ncbi:hypothetical protein [Aeromonas caviae]|uniref:hypothetical protein n=1 Tax=Aeromonas caviae TaxID=648 RepID=UPI002B4A932B|nr:hypothetical protein [Aeromonas caviae]